MAARRLWRRAPLLCVAIYLPGKSAPSSAPWWKVVIRSCGVALSTALLHYEVARSWPHIVAHVPATYAGLVASVGAALTAYFMTPPHKQ